MIGMPIAALATAAVVAVGGLMLPARAQPRTAPQDTPADVKALVFDLANSMGMLRASEAPIQSASPPIRAGTSCRP